MKVIYFPAKNRTNICPGTDFYLFETADQIMTRTIKVHR